MVLAAGSRIFSNVFGLSKIMHSILGVVTCLLLAVLFFLFLPTQDVYLVFSSPLGENRKCFFSFSSKFILRSYPIAQPIPLCHRYRYFGCPEVIFLIHSAILLRLCFWALLDRTLDPRRDNGSCCFESCISGISFTLSKPSQLFSLMTNFSFPFCFYHENKGGKKYEGCPYLFIFFSMP